MFRPFNMISHGSVGAKYRLSIWILALTAATWVSLLSSARAEPTKTKDAHQIDFGRDIQPIFSDFCFQCHGQDESSRKARLRLDEKAQVLGKLRSGEIGIVPGKPHESEIYRRISATDVAERMPPAGLKKQLSPAQVVLIRKWIEEGANWRSHWAFEPVGRQEPPAVKDSRWPRNGIDQFILDRMTRQGFTPTAAADKSTLIRRLSLTLHGLPPRLDEVDAFVNDKAEDAYEKLVDRLLRSPRYGERMAQRWLDWSRFGDTTGKHWDRPHVMWPWRDWVIRSFNANMPFDQFTIEQLAGDLLPNPTNDQLLATGFHRNVIRGADDNTPDSKMENRVGMISDMVNTTGAVWLGVTFQCAQCHDHKYDPIPQKDFYRLYAFFDKQSDGPWRKGEGDDGNSLPTMTITWQQDGEAKPMKLPVMIMRDEKIFPETHVLIRGDFKNRGPKVTAGVPEFLHTPLEGEHAQDRLGLARWLVDPRNPLPSRVIANRLWEHVFGTALVKTMEDFGHQGEFPTHPELLDWLARQLVADGWDVKKFLKRLLMSSTFRQASTASKELVLNDPSNQCYARYSRSRLSGEAIRDNALAISGLLDERRGGPPVYPQLPASVVEFYQQSGKYVPSSGSDLYRRSIYVFYKRSLVYPPFALFDAPTRETCTIRRNATNTPLQALVLLNEQVYLDCSRNMAWELCQITDKSTDDKLSLAFRKCTARRPNAAELAVLNGLLRTQKAYYAAHPDAAQRLLVRQDLTQLADRPAVAAWIVVCNALLNLDETITRE